LYHVRHRVYDPMGGRWLQRDPIGMAGGWNLYQYCGGEPWGYVDPMGLEGITIGEFFSALGTELWGHQGFVASFSDGVGGLFDGTASDVVAAAAVQAEINTAARTGGEVTETGVAMTLLAQFIGAQDIATAVTGYDANVDGIVDTTDRVAAGLRGGGSYLLIASGALPGQKVPGKVPGAVDDVPKPPTAPAAAEPAGGGKPAAGQSCGSAGNGTGSPTTKPWSETSKLSAEQNAAAHAAKHAAEFPELAKGEYIKAAQRFVEQPPQGVLVKTRPNGDTLLYDPATNTFAVRTADGVPRTMFRPTDGIKYWNKQ